MAKQLFPPYKGAKITDISQKFGVNPQEYQPDGHRGVDFAPVNGYGMFLVAPENVLIKNIITPSKIDNSLKDLDRGYGILMKSQSEPNLHYLYWHCLPVFPVNIGDYVSGGQIVGLMGNSGMVYMGGKFVPLAERVKTKWGTHLHYEMIYFIEDVRNNYIDVLPHIDFSKQISYDILTAIKAMIQKLSNLIMNR